jgi:predicted nucleic acid-binding protein
VVAALYLDTSAVLRAVLETGTTPEIESEIQRARALITSRLSLVESTRVVHRLRLGGRTDEARLAEGLAASCGS